MARTCSTICLPASKEDYLDLVEDPKKFRLWLDKAFLESPELFPKAFSQGYRLKDDRVSKKTELRIRRVRLHATNASFSIRPSFVLPYMTAEVEEAQRVLFLRSFGVPFWALSHVFGKDSMHWYRMEVSLGRNSIVGTTVRQVAVPEHLLADEHHTKRDGEKNYMATTVAEGCCLGASLAERANEKELQTAYGVFGEEAENVQPGYKPQTVSVDGWAATSQAWLVLFPLVALLRCFLHGWLSLRSRGKLSDCFFELSGKVWEAFRAPSRRVFSQRLRRLREWAKKQFMSNWLLEKVEKLCSRSKEYGRAYDHPQGHRTSNMLDRVMRSMNRYFEEAQHLHGKKASCERHCRAWALLYNFRPWHPATTKRNQDWRSPAERLNQHRYHNNWLENLLVSASLAGYRR